MDRMQTERDDSLKAHLATKVMGRREGARSPSGARVWIDDATGGAYYDSSLDSWADAGKAWEKAREMGIVISLTGAPLAPWMAQTISHDSKDASGPRAICEAVAMVTGWEEPQ